MTEDDEKAEKDDEDTPIRRSRRTDRKSDQRNENDSTNWVRRSSRQTKTTSDGNDAELEGCLSDGTHHSPENGVRRSKREHHKPSFYDPVAYEKPQSSSDDEDEEDEEEEEDDDDDDEEEGVFKSFLSL